MPIPSKEEIQELGQLIRGKPGRATPTQKTGITPPDLKILEGVHQERLKRDRKEAVGERSALGEIALGVPRGVVGATELTAKAGRAVEGALIPGTERGPIANRLLTPFLEAVEEKRKVSPWMQTAPRYEEGIVGTISQGTEQAVQSIIAGIPGGVAGRALGAGIGASLGSVTLPGVGTVTGATLGMIGGYALSGGTIFGLAQYDDVISRADEKRIPREISQPVAIRSAIYEGGFEFISDLLEMGFMKVGKPLTAPAQQTVKKGIGELFKVGWKGYLARLGGVIGAEVPTEMATAALQAEEERKIGLGETKMWDAAKQAFGPSLVASVIFGGTFGTINKLQRTNVRRKLENPDAPKEDRKKAALEVEQILKEFDPEIAQVWGHNAFVAIENGEAIKAETPIEEVGGFAPTAPAEEVIEEAPTVTPPEAELATTEEDIERIYTPEQLAELEKGADKGIQDHLNALNKRIANLESMKKRSPKQEANLKAYQEERKTIMEEQGYDKEGEGRLPGAIREGEEPGRPLQDREGSKKEIKAGGIFQTSEGEEIEVPGIEFRDDMTPADLDDQWGKMVTIQDQLTEKNEPRLKEIEKELAALKGKREKPDQEKRKALREEAQKLKDEPAAFMAGAENSFINAQEDFNDRVIAKAKERGVEDEETQGEIAELAGRMLTERQYTEQTWNWPISKVIDEAISEYVEQEEAVPAAPEKPAKEAEKVGKEQTEQEKLQAIEEFFGGEEKKPREKKVGDKLKVANKDAVVKRVQKIDGVEYELYGAGEGGIIRIFDTDANEVVQAKTFPKFGDAEKAYLEAVKTLRKPAKPTKTGKPYKSKPGDTPQGIVKALGGIYIEEGGEADFAKVKEGGGTNIGIVSKEGLPFDMLRERFVEEGIINSDTTLSDFKVWLKDNWTKPVTEKGIEKAAEEEHAKEMERPEEKGLEEKVIADLDLEEGDVVYTAGDIYKVKKVAEGEVTLEDDFTITKDEFDKITLEKPVVRAKDIGKLPTEVKKQLHITKKPAEEVTEKNYQDYWDSKLKLGRKVELAKDAGWITRSGQLSKLGEKISSSRWEELSPAAQNVLKPRIDNLYKPGAKTNPVSEWVVEQIGKKRLFVAKDLFDQADKHFGGTQAQGKYVAKDAYDLMELGVNQYLDQVDLTSNPTADIKQAKQIVVALKQLVNKLPTQTKRTEESDEFQQFSTPPHLAFVVNWAANLNKDDVVLEPSAGIGGIAVFAKQADVSKVIVNELSKKRLDLLQQLDFDEYYNLNAEQIDNTLPDTVKPTVVVMNPPFSSTAGRMEGKRDTKFATRHIEQAMARLEPGGRLVTIVGKGMGLNSPVFREWWDKKDYNVRANIRISGREYKKYGNTFDNRIIVIDKTSKKADNIITGKVEKVEDLLPLLEGIRNDRAYPAKQLTTQPTGEKTPTESGQGVQRPASVPSPTGVVGIGQGGGGTEGQKAPAGERGGTATPVETGERPQVPTSKPIGGQPGTPTGEREGKPPGVSPGHTPSAGQQASGKPDELSKRKRPTLKPKKFTDSVFEDFEPEQARIEGSKPHPTPLVQSAAMAAVEPPGTDYIPNLPKEPIKSGALSSAQLDPIIGAGQAHSEILPNGERRGYFIGDGAGVGKGREIAGILWDNWNRGRKKAVWVSAKWTLFEDAKRDVEDIGWDKTLLFKQGHGNYKISDEFKEEEGIAFTTYNTLVKEKGEEETEVSRLEQIRKWFGEDFDGAIVFDESHKMGNALEVKGKMGISKPSQTALKGIDFQRAFPNARLLYVSATGATEVLNLAYAERLGLWGEGTAFGKKTSFVNQIASAGLAAMELVARDLKAFGSYVSRSLSFDGVEYQRVEHKLNEKQKKEWDIVVDAWQMVLDNIEDALGVTSQDSNSKSKRSINSRFWNEHQRFFNQVLTTMQMPSALEHAKKEIEKGNAVIFQLVNTNEAQQQRSFAKMQEGDEIEDLDMTPKERLIDFVENGFPTQQYEEFTDPDGNTRSRPLFNADGSKMVNKEAMRLKEQLLNQLSGLKGLAGPLDALIDFFGADKIAEVTGRGRRVVVDPNTKKKIIQKRSPSSIKAEVDDFLDDKLQALAFSDAGGTGVSYHADRRYKNQRKRIHYVLQAGWRADNAVQGMGRSHRSNEAQPPEYVLVHTDLQGQKRFISTIARRLDQLGALTKGQRQAGSQGIFKAADNLESSHARDALRVFLRDIVSGKIPEISVEEFEKQTRLEIVDEHGNILSNLPEMNRFLNRLLNLKVDFMDKVFDAFEQRLQDNVRAHEEAGTLDVGIENLTGQSVDKASEQVVYTDERTGAETKYVELDVVKPAERLTFEDAKSHFRGGKGFYQNKQSGMVWVSSKERDHTDLTSGVARRVFHLVNAGSHRQRVYTSTLEDSDKWEHLTPEEAAGIWDKAYSEMPATRTERHNLVTGAILPVWDRLPTKHTRVLRTQTSEGELLLGRVVHPNEVQETLKKLGATATGVELKPSEAFDKIYNERYQAELSNDWKIVNRRVAGESRIEIIGPDWEHTEELRKHGVFTERINYNLRYFIPVGDQGIKTFEAIIKNRPIIQITPPSSARFARAAKEATGIPVEEINNTINPILKNLKGLTPGVNVVNSISELSSELQKEAKKVEGAGVKAVFDKETNEITLVAEGFSSVDEAKEALFHELYGHFGARRLFGKAFDPFLVQVYNSYGPKKLKDIADLYGLDFSKKEDRLTAAEEKLAQMAAKNEKPGLLRRIYAYIKNWLRKMGFNFKITDDDLKIIVCATKRAIEEGYDIGELRGAATKFAREREPVAVKAEKVLKQFPVKYEGIQKGFMGQEDVVAFKDRKKKLHFIPVSEFSEEAVRKKLGIKEPSKQMGFKFAKEKEVSPTKEPMAALPTQVRPRIEAARGIPKTPILERAERLGEKIKASTTRHFADLDPKLHAYAINQLRRFQEIGEATKESALNFLKDTLSDLTPAEYDAFSMNLLLSDMLHDIDAISDPETGKRLLDPADGLPFEFKDRAEVVSTLNKFKKMAEENPKIKAALDKRKKFMNKLKKDLINDKFLPKTILKNEDYWHHQVLEYMQKKYEGKGKDVRVHKKGWQIARIGSIKDYNTEYAESEFEVVSQGLAQLRAKEILDELEKEYNIVKSLRTKAKDTNIAKLWEVLRDKGEIETDELGQEIDPLKPYSIKIAMGFGKLGKLAADGELYGPPEYEGIIEDLADSYEQKKAAMKDMPDDPDMWGSVTTDNPLIFQYLSYLINSKQEGAQSAATIFNGIRERNSFIKNSLGNQFSTWETMLDARNRKAREKGEQEYADWKPKPFTAWYVINSINDKILEQVIAGNRDLSESDIKKIMGRGLDETWVIPASLAKTMDDFNVSPNKGPISAIAERSLNLWKQYILMNPLRIAKYNFNNLSGDSDITLAYNPKIITKYALKAAKDLWKYHYRHNQLSPELKAEFETARKEAVIASGMTVHDIPDIVKGLQYENFIRVLQGKKPNLIQRYWGGSKKFTTWRENVLRFAAFRQFKDRIAAGEKNLYGVSNREVAEATPIEGDQKAALLARDLLGDYGNITQAGQWLRRKAIPFYSWMEINAPRYYKLFRNLPLEGRGRKGAISMASMSFAKEGAALAFRASMLYGAIMLYNMLVWPDEEEELGESGRRQLHLILGRRDDGSIMTLRFQGALSDALEWIGMEDAPQDVKDLLTRKMSFYDLAKDAGKGFLNKPLRGIRPDVKMAFELPMGKSMYPDIFKARPIRDKMEHILRTFSLDIPYKRATGMPIRGKTTGGRLLQDISSLLLYTTDPGEMAYYDTRKFATDYLEDHNLSRPMIEPTAKSNALYYYKRALKFADFKAAEKYLKKYAELGGTMKGLKISIKLAHPMSSVPTKHRKAFFGGLSKGDRERVKQSIKWYEQTYRGRKEAA